MGAVDKPHLIHEKHSDDLPIPLLFQFPGSTVRIATIHLGDRRNPGPIRALWIVVILVVSALLLIPHFAYASKAPEVSGSEIDPRQSVLDPALENRLLMAEAGSLIDLIIYMDTKADLEEFTLTENRNDRRHLVVNTLQSGLQRDENSDCRRLSRWRIRFNITQSLRRSGSTCRLFTGYHEGMISAYLQSRLRLNQRRVSGYYVDVARSGDTVEVNRVQLDVKAFLPCANADRIKGRS